MSANEALPPKLLGLYDLPVEVRHQIYKHLFCHEPSPISFAPKQHAMLAMSPTVEDSSPSPPIFYTSIFRVNKAISRDALQFAYSANSFLLSNHMDVTRLCSLGETALASMKSVCVFNIGFVAAELPRRMWYILKTRCPNLELLVLNPSGFILAQVIPYLKDFLCRKAVQTSRPEVLLDLYILDRHFSFDLPDRDYRQALKTLTSRPGPDAREEILQPKQVVLNMPKQVKHIHLVADVSPGLVRALDETLENDPTLRFVRTSPSLFPANATRQHVGRQRVCYLWNSADQEEG